MNPKLRALKMRGELSQTVSGEDISRNNKKKFCEGLFTARIFPQQFLYLYPHNRYIRAQYRDSVTSTAFRDRFLDAFSARAVGSRLSASYDDKCKKNASGGGFRSRACGAAQGYRRVVFSKRFRVAS